MVSKKVGQNGAPQGARSSSSRGAQSRQRAQNIAPRTTTSAGEPGLKKGFRIFRLQPVVGWRNGAKWGFRRWCQLAGLVSLWVILGHFGLVEEHFAHSCTLVFMVVLFALAMPVSFIIHLDTIALEYGFQSSAIYDLLLALPVVLLNFLFWGMLRGWWRSVFPLNNSS